MARCSPARLAAAALAVALAACFTPAIEDGLPCSETLACPSGQRCDTTTDPPVCRSGAAPAGVDASVDGSPTTDRDGDGVVDADDNCPAIANADQRDRDGDVHGDRCDPCPTVADPVPRDGDGDGIGDACDPWPTQPDRVLAYEEFDAPLGPPWDASPDATYQGGYLVPQPTIPYATWSARYPLPATSARIAVELGVALDASDEMYPYPSAKVFLDGTFETDGTVTNVECGVVRIPTGGHEVALDEVVHDAYHNLGSATVAIAPTTRVVLARTKTPTSAELRCTAGLGDAPTTLASPTAVPIGANVGLFIDHWRGRFDYVVIYAAAP